MRRFRWILSLCAVVTASCGGGDATGPATVKTVTVSSAVTTVVVGASAQFTATARDAEGSVVTGTIEWSSSATSIATVQETGLVSAVGVGQATITAKIGGVSGSLALTVDPNPAGSALVTMPGLSFAPFTTTVNRGGTVIFEFPSVAHNVIFGAVNGAPTDIQTTANRRVSRTFNTVGTFPYDCNLHPGMSGVVVVQ